MVDEGAPITVKVKVHHTVDLTNYNSFLNHYAVYMHKGATGSYAINPNLEDAVFNTLPSNPNKLVSIANRGRRYVPPVNPQDCILKFNGTIDEAGVDSNGYFEMTLSPSSGKWLEPDQPFCAFGIYLVATLRHTNGKHGSSYPDYHAIPVLIGIQKPLP